MRNKNPIPPIGSPTDYSACTASISFIELRSDGRVSTKTKPAAASLGITKNEYRNFKYHKGKISRDQSKYEYFPISIDY